METFLDSFENPEYYLSIQDEDNSYGLNTENGEYIIIQKASHPEFSVKESESILYVNDGELICDKVKHITEVGAIKSYHLTEEENYNNEPIYDFQVIGKVIKIVDSNLWNSISLSIWETSINNINLNALLTND